MSVMFSRACRLVVVAIVLLAIWQLPRLTIDNNLLALFPSNTQSEAQRIAEQSLSQKYERQALLLLTAEEPDDIRRALPDITAKLKSCRCIAWAGSDRSADNNSAALDAIYAGHARELLTASDRERLQNYPMPGIKRQRLRELLTSPGALNEQTLSQDPLGNLQNFLNTLAPLPEALKIDGQGNPYLIIDDERYYLLRLELSASPFALNTQAEFSHALANALAEVRLLPGFKQLQTGAIFYTLAGTEQARREVSTVGLGSALGVTLLLLLVFRRAELLLLAFAPIALGVVAGLVFTQWIFGRVHVMALVFGAALVGVAIDYSLHFFAKRLDSGPHWQAREGSRRLFVPLSLGLISSCAGYLSFVASGFPGFMQIAVLSSAGLVAAYAFVLGWYPLLLARPQKHGLPRWLAIAIDAVIDVQFLLLRQVRKPVVIFGLFLLLGWGALQWQVNDDIRSMQSIDPQLQNSEQTIREHMAGQPALQYFLLQAPDADTLLRRSEALQQKLDILVRKQKLGGYHSLSQWLPSLTTQKANAELWQQRVLDSGLLAELYGELGVKPNQVEAYLRRWQQERFLEPGKALAAISRLPGAPGYYVRDGKFYGVVQLLAPIDGEALAGLAAKHSHRQWVDPVARTSGLLQTYRERASVLLLVAYGIIFCVLSARYGFKGALAVITPPALASALALALVLTWGQAISVFHIMALLLVLGIGVDYSLFWRESGRQSRATVLAIGLSACTTVLSFGLLSLSSTAAIHSFGAVVLSGILLVFVLAPLALGRGLSE
ncbi:MMPL family transporter [Gilvimarinus sp. DA14]|uniref:MMPL family transporter n=1 Tax=Gilvimarinus sp. DA14 TaxID=2956798 RepID=UPI0020B7E87E|nr:hypothetical protein [Gilvimarinus sp. DA14]UTF59732.1 hypothetical protein NHM04_14855 [Gilvimarinus sp. DA14]